MGNTFVKNCCPEQEEVTLLLNVNPLRILQQMSAEQSSRNLSAQHPKQKCVINCSYVLLFISIE